jgi:ABC-type Zn uptake system ZnuABC Zn-binding protein ZnuA
VNRVRSGLFVVACFVALAACTLESSEEIPIASLSALDLAPGERLQVEASTTIVAEVLANVGGEDIVLTTTLPLGADPHEFEPTPREIERLSQTDALFVSGLGYETVLQRTLAEAGLVPRTLALSEGLTPEVDPAADPHVWLDPRNVMSWVDNAAKALSALDPDHADDYAGRALAYRGRLQELDGRLEDLAAQLPSENRKIVADHEALGHLAARYDFEIVGSLIPGPSSAAEPSARDLAQLQSAMQAEGIRVVFLTSLGNRSLAERVAADSGARLVQLYAESLSEPGGPADSYIKLMEYNLAAIVEALNSP